MRFISILVLAGLASPALGTTIIDFEDWTGGPGDQTSITSGGFTFFGGPFFIAPHPEAGNPTLALQTRSCVLWVSRADGGPFSLISIDLQEGLPANPSEMLSLTGVINSGGGVKLPFWLDGVAATYETFYPVGYTGINSLELVSDPGPGSTFSLDNIVVVPEPATLCMIILVLCLAHRSRF